MSNRTIRAIKIASTAALLSASVSLAAEAAPKVATSIAPVYSITAAIMQDIGTPSLLIDQATSPHTAKLQPSDAKALQEADLVVWIGAALTPSLEKPIETLSEKASVLTLSKIDGLTELAVRTGGNWEKHVHADDDHDEDHDADHHDGDHEEHDDHDHDHEGHDPHVWLDPLNGIAMAKAIAKSLSTIDPENASRYQANAEAFKTRLTASMDTIKKDLEPIKDKPYIVFHDAYHYFENRFGISAVGSVMLQPGVAPGAARVREIRAKLKELNVVCIMAEPQFSDKILNTLVEGTDTKIGQMDPTGTNLKLGPDLYDALMHYNADKIRECLQ
nr:zinc ABC transporter substrate-binding protein ZnuA [uncultured Cohaesibacter sp.]